MTEPKLQYSRFVGPNRSGQIVVRSDDFDEFTELYAKMMAFVKENGMEDAPSPQNGNTEWLSKDENTPVKCHICGQPTIEKRGTSKSGKDWHALFCSSDDKSHTRWL